MKTAKKDLAPYEVGDDWPYRIPVGDGLYAKVDPWAFASLVMVEWSCLDGYAIADDGQGRIMSMHRVVNRTPDGLDTDHINGDRLDNRQCNLRSVTRAENLTNHHGCHGKTIRRKLEKQGMIGTGMVPVIKKLKS